LQVFQKKFKYHFGLSSPQFNAFLPSLIFLIYCILLIPQLKKYFGLLKAKYQGGFADLLSLSND